MKFTVFLFSFLSLTFLNSAVTSTPGRSTAISEKIFDGKNTGIEEMPYIVVLPGRCGGSIISEWHILTAAHCVTNEYTKNPEDLEVRAGSSYVDKGGSLHTVAAYAIHEDYLTNEFVLLKSDLAIIKLAEPIEIDNITKKVIGMFEPEMESEPESVALVGGWGYTDLNGTRPKQLQSVHVKIVDKAECGKIYEEASVYSDDIVCALGNENGKIQNTFLGDSGGPLIIDGKLAGIVSYVDGNSNESPAGYTEVSYYRDWIDDKLADNSSSSVKPLSIEEFPFLVTVGSYYFKEESEEESWSTIPSCLGTILSPIHVLTAAHCYLNYNDGNLHYWVHAGSSLKNQNGSSHHVIDWIIYPGYYNEGPSYENDIAVLILEEPIEFDNISKKSIALADPEDEISPGDDAIRPDWWWEKTTKWFFPEQLHSLKLKVVECEEVLNLDDQQLDRVQDRIFCASPSLDNPQNLYGGLPGGPLIIDRKLYGISLFPNSYVPLNDSDAYIEVSYFRNWIDSLIGS